MEVSGLIGILLRVLRMYVVGFELSSVHKEDKLKRTQRRHKENKLKTTRGHKENKLKEVQC